MKAAVGEDFSSRHLVYRRLWLPGSRKKPFFPSARAGQLELRAPEIPPEFRPRGDLMEFLYHGV